MLRRNLSVAASVLSIVVPLTPAAAQGPPPGARDTTTGFEIKDSAIIANCSGCHVRDSTGRLGRLSFMRKTPEGWETSLRRMMTLQNVRVEPAVARAIVKYLSDNQGLAPEELRPGRFEVERRLIEHRYTADAQTERTCRACHSLGRVITQRRTRSEWELLLTTHRAYYPLADGQGFRRSGPPPRDSAGAGHPMDAVVGHLARVFPLRTPEWAAWSATMRPPPLQGAWLLTGTDGGKGAFHGRLTINETAPGEYTTRATYRFVSGGRAVTREGKAVVYTGYQWRGRSSESSAGKDEEPWREVLFVEPGWQEMSGRWFRGAYDEFGIDVTMQRVTAGPTAIGISPRALRSGLRGQEITIFGANLPRDGRTLAVDFGPGVRLERVVRSTPDSVTVRVGVDSGSAVGARDLFIAGASLRAAAVVYDSIDRIRVTPRHGMARVGGLNFPKQYQQFAAVAYHDGIDRKPDTDDDLELGPVKVTWSVEEYAVTYDDDDIKFVGSLDQRGTFTPAGDGPNPQRSGSRNNVGDVWVVATYQPPGRSAKPLKARALLVVTVPLYMRWEPWRAEEGSTSGTRVTTQGDSRP